MPILQSESFSEIAASAEDILLGPLLGPEHSAARLELWRRQEWHNWFRWRVCARGRDWSKPVWIALLAGGFAALIAYGFKTDRLYVTAGGCVLWFALVNLGFFAYFGLTLPGPPLPVPGPFPAGLRVRAAMGLYPPGYERRKLARVHLRVPAPQGAAWRMELAFAQLPADLAGLLKRQETWRIQRADAPLTQAVIETLPVTREQIDAGAQPVRIVAWQWDEQALDPFRRQG